MGGSWNGDIEYVDLPGCLDTVVFNVSVVVLDHLWLQFQPINGSNECPTYIFDSQVLQDETGVYSVGILQPEGDVIENTPELKHAFSSGWSMGVISAEDLLDAIDTFDGQYEENYDIVTANCAAKIINVLYYLYLPVEDRAFLVWLGEQLQTDYVMELLRASPNITLLYPAESVDAIKAKPDAELITRLVDYSLTKEIAEYNATLEYYKSLEKAPRAAPRAPVSAPFVRSPSSASPAVGSSPSGSTVGTPQANGKVSSASFVTLGWMTLGVAAIFVMSI